MTGSSCWDKHPQRLKRCGVRPEPREYDLPYGKFFETNNCFEQKQEFEKKNMYQFIDLRQNGRTKPTDKNYRMNKTVFQFELSGPIPDKLSSTNHSAH